MNIRLLVFPAAIVLIAACASGPKTLNSAPDWMAESWMDTEKELAFRGQGSGISVVQAKNSTVESLEAAVLRAMDLGDPSGWEEEGRLALAALMEELVQVLGNAQKNPMDGVSVVRQQGWRNSDGTASHAADILWSRSLFNAETDRIASLAGVGGPMFRGLESRARTAEGEGNGYEASLIWSVAAGVASDNGNTANLKQAFQQVLRILDGLDYTVEQTSGDTAVGTRPSRPVVFRVEFAGKPLSNAEFVITYPRANRDGSPSRSEARVLSDADGRVSFRQPNIPFQGQQAITLAPSAQPFLKNITTPVEGEVAEFVSSLEQPRASAVYDGLIRYREIPTGVLIIETDLAGNPLDSAAARGLISDLTADGFDASLMSLDSREMLSRSEQALLRDLKADTRFSDRYGRVVHGRITLESFEQKGDIFTVKVSGTLFYSDIERQVTIHRSSISKTSQAGDGQQAMSAAFRQVGRSFAAELIALSL